MLAVHNSKSEATHPGSNQQPTLGGATHPESNPGSNPGACLVTGASLIKGACLVKGAVVQGSGLGSKLRRQSLGRFPETEIKLRRQGACPVKRASLVKGSCHGLQAMRQGAVSKPEQRKRQHECLTDMGGKKQRRM